MLKTVEDFCKYCGLEYKVNRDFILVRSETELVANLNSLLKRDLDVTTERINVAKAKLGE